MTASDEASGTPREFTFLQDMNRELKKALAAKGRELQQARTMHAEAIEEWAKWEGAAKQARGEALAGRLAEQLAHATERVRLASAKTQHEDSILHVALGDLYGCVGRAIRALKPSPASGEQINAAGQASGQPHFARGQENKPAPAAPNTATQMAAAATLPVTPAVEAGQPAAAVPDDPVAVYWKLQTDADFMSGDEAIRALAAHYLHRAPEGYALVPLDRITSVTRAFDYLGNNINEPWVKVCFKHDDWSGRDSFANALATTKQEADR